MLASPRSGFRKKAANHRSFLLPGRREGNKNMRLCGIPFLTSFSSAPPSEINLNRNKRRRTLPALCCLLKMSFPKDPSACAGRLRQRRRHGMPSWGRPSNGTVSLLRSPTFETSHPCWLERNGGMNLTQAFSGFSRFGPIPQPKLANFERLPGQREPRQHNPCGACQLYGKGTIFRNPTK